MSTNAVATLDLTGLTSYDPASDTYMDPDAPVVMCDSHTARDIDPFSGRCWECGEQVPGLVRA